MKKIFKILPLLFICLTFFTGCLGNSGINPSEIQYIQLEAPKQGDDIAVFDTSMGEITVLLYTEEVPEIVQNFKDLVNEGYYDGQVIFQIDPDYMISAFGSTDKLGTEANSNEGKPKKAEYSQNLWPFSGSLCTITYQSGMVFKNMSYDSRSFFIGDVALTDNDREKMESSGFPVMMKNTFEAVGGIPAYSQYHSVYGKVISGMDVVNAIAKAQFTEEEPTEEEIKQAEEKGAQLLTVKRPSEDIVINKVTLSSYDPANFDKLENCLTDEEYTALKEKSEKEQAELDAIAMGETE